MEKITNYKIKDFFKINDDELISAYMEFLNYLNPLKEVTNPKRNWYKKGREKLQIKAVRMLSFGDVTNIRNNFNSPTENSIIDSVSILTGLSYKEVMNFTILEFYGIISYIRAELIELSAIEENELADDHFDKNIEAVNANKRMAKFGVLNTINAIADNDVLKWKEIEKLPYLTVLAKLMMDNEKNKIQREIAELQKKQSVNK